MALIGTDEKKTTTPSTTTTTTPSTTTTTTTTQEVTSPTAKVETPSQTAPAVKPNVSAYDKTMQALKEAENGVPSFSSDYDSTISELYDKIVNRQPFKYDYSSDPLYGQYKESYTQQGRQAMRDTMGQAAALTGGYGSSYGQAVGQQQYDAYMQRLNDVLPQLYGMARDVYKEEGDTLNTHLSLAGALRDTEYNQFRDAVGDDQYDDAWDLQEAEALAQYGNFSGFEDLYGKEQADQMRLTWASANPDAAWTAGLITEDEYYKLTGNRPRGGLSASSGGGFKASTSDIIRNQLDMMAQSGSISQADYVSQYSNSLKW